MKEQQDLAKYLTRLLMILGFSPRHYGFGYIREMLLISFESNNKKLAHVYPAVALKHDVPVEAVQTAVRTALKNAQESESFAQLENLLGVKFIEPRYTLAPREFIGIMVEYLTYVWDGKCESLIYEY